MAADFQRFVTSEEDDDDGDTIIDVKEEDDGDVDEGEKFFEPPTIVGVSGTSTGTDTNFCDHQPYQGLCTTSQGRTRKRTPQEEKERTKLRERQRRAITAKILAGLRKHGNYNLKPRSDINDVIAALAREAGWEVEPDGTTYPVSRSQVLLLVAYMFDNSQIPPGFTFLSVNGETYPKPNEVIGISTTVILLP